MSHVSKIPDILKALTAPSFIMKSEEKVLFSSVLWDWLFI